MLKTSTKESNFFTFFLILQKREHFKEEWRISNFYHKSKLGQKHEKFHFLLKHQRRRARSLFRVFWQYFSLLYHCTIIFLRGKHLKVHLDTIPVIQTLVFETYFWKNSNFGQKAPRWSAKNHFFQNFRFFAISSI